MKKLSRWIRRWWWLALVAVGAVASAAVHLLIFRRPPSPDRLEREFKAIEAGRKAAELEAEKGRGMALAKLEMEHADTLEDMDEEMRAKAEKMASDPEALARWLVRMGKS